MLYFVLIQGYNGFSLKETVEGLEEAIAKAKVFQEHPRGVSAVVFENDDVDAVVHHEIRDPVTQEWVPTEW